MSAQKTILNNLLPASVGGKIVIFIFIIIAFSLGSFFSGGESPSVENHDEHAEHASDVPTTWTCSMHPQIQLPKEGKCPICYMDLIPLENNDDDSMSENQIKLSENAKKIARIQSTEVTRGYASRIVHMNGKIDYDETRVAYITARFPGRLDTLFADYTGMQVNKGDHLASIYSPQLLSAQEELIQAVKTIKKLKDSDSRVLQRTAYETLEAAREKLHLYELTDEQIQLIEKSKMNSDHLTIYSPIKGVVVHKNAKEGIYVQTGNKIYTIADLSKLWVYFDAYESDLVWLRVGQTIEFTTTSFASESFSGTISFINPIVNQQSRTVRVRAVIDNKNNLLKPDMLVHGQVSSKINSNGQVINDELAGKWISPMHPEIVKDKPGQCDVCGMDLVSAKELGYSSSNKLDNAQPILIPASALLITGRQAVVFVETKSEDASLYEARYIEIGPKAGDSYIVLSGLEVGEKIVTNGAFKIDAELQIQAKPSMMSPDGGVAPMVHDHGQMKEMTDPSNDIEADTLIVTDKMLTELSPIYNAYFELQMALAMDDFDTSIKFYNALAQALDEIDIDAFSGIASQKWSEFSKQIVKYARLGKTANKIVTARDLFFHLSKTFIKLEETFGHADAQNYYLTFCPMARDNNGAYWLQTKDTVYNSFYGDMMLHCGSIEDTLPTAGGN